MIILFCVLFEKGEVWMKYNIFIVDDYWVVCEGFKLILEISDNYFIVGEVEEGEEVIWIMLDK